MATNPEQRHYSIEEWRALQAESGHRYEYDRGAVFMTGGKSEHAWLIGVLAFRLNQHIYGSPCRVYTADGEVRITDDIYICPDIVISCNVGDFRQSQIKLPRIIMEVLSPSTEARDRGRKFTLCRTLPSLQEYLLVDTEYAHIELYRRQEDNTWKLFEFGLDDMLTLESIDVEIEMKEIYEHA